MAQGGSAGGARVALVSGGTRGIGEAIARALASDGWRVVAGGIGPDEIADFRPDPQHRADPARRDRR